MPIKVFKSSRGKTVLLLLISLAFVATAVFVPWSDKVLQVLCGGFFGLGVVVFTFLLLRPQQLTLDTEGFTLSGGLMLPARAKRIPWRDVDDFFTYRTGRGNKMIGINFTAGASGRTRLARFSRAAFGADGALPGLWPGGCEKMVQELTDYRARALGQQQNLTAPRSSAG